MYTFDVEHGLDEDRRREALVLRLYSGDHAHAKAALGTPTRQGKSPTTAVRPKAERSKSLYVDGGGKHAKKRTVAA